MTALPTIESAVELAKAGDRKASWLMVIEILKADPNHVEAWLLAASLTNNSEQQAHALRQVLSLRPGNVWAAEQLRRLEDEVGANADISPKKLKHRPSANTTSVHERAITRRTLFLRIAGVVLAGIAMIALGGMFVLNVLPSPLSDGIENELPTLITQQNAPTQSIAKHEPNPDLATAADDSTRIPTNTLAPNGQGVTPSGPETAVVIKVIDGDTIEVKLDGKTVIVQYLGIRVPVLDEACGKQAADYNASLVDGKTVNLVREISDVDSGGRLLRHVYVESLFVNAEMIAQGYALAAIVPPDISQSEYFWSLEQQARVSNEGCLDKIPTSTEIGGTSPGAGEITITTEPAPSNGSDGPPNFPTSTPALR